MKYNFYTKCYKIIADNTIILKMRHTILSPIDEIREDTKYYYLNEKINALLGSDFHFIIHRNFFGKSYIYPFNNRLKDKIYIKDIREIRIEKTYEPCPPPALKDLKNFSAPMVLGYLKERGFKINFKDLLN